MAPGCAGNQSLRLIPVIGSGEHALFRDAADSGAVFKREVLDGEVVCIDGCRRRPERADFLPVRAGHLRVQIVGQGPWLPRLRRRAGEMNARNAKAPLRRT